MARLVNIITLNTIVDLQSFRCAWLLLYVAETVNTSLARSISLTSAEGDVIVTFNFSNVHLLLHPCRRRPPHTKTSFVSAMLQEAMMALGASTMIDPEW